MFRIVFTVVLVLILSRVSAQQNYCDFDGISVIKLLYKSGKINIKSKNPSPNEVNESERCAKYIRTSSVKYDNIKFQFERKLEDVSKFSSYDASAPRIRMKVYTSAPPGTLIEIQLAKKNHHDYPMSVHSQYQAFTTKQNEWEELVFSFSQVPKGSIIRPGDIDQLNILFAPDTQTKAVFYFDDIMGPAMLDENYTSSGRKKR